MGAYSKEEREKQLYHALNLEIFYSHLCRFFTSRATYIVHIHLAHLGQRRSQGGGGLPSQDFEDKLRGGSLKGHETEGG